MLQPVIHTWGITAGGNTTKTLLHHIRSLTKAEHSYPRAQKIHSPWIEKQNSNPADHNDTQVCIQSHKNTWMSSQQIQIRKTQRQYSARWHPFQKKDAALSHTHSPANSIPLEIRQQQKESREGYLSNLILNESGAEQMQKIYTAK